MFGHVVRQGSRRRPRRRRAEARQRLWLVAAWRRAGGGRRRSWLRVLVDAASVRCRLHGLVHADAEPGERRRISRIRRIRLRAVAASPACGSASRRSRRPSNPAVSVELHPPRQFIEPDFTPPPGGLHYRWPDLPGPQIEERMEAKKMAVFAFAEANPIDRRIYDIPDASFGIVTTGKAPSRPDGGAAPARPRRSRLPQARHRHLQGRHGVAAGSPRRAGVRAAASSEILVVEEKRGIIESQLKEYFYDYPGHKPRAHGRQARRGRRPADPLDRRAVAANAGADRRQAARCAVSRSRPRAARGER